MKKPCDPNVAAVFKAYPPKVAAKLMFLRRLILDTAARTKGVGPLLETLRWGQPSYITAETKSGSIIRIDSVRAQQTQYAMYFHCQTDLVDRFKRLYADKFVFGGDRSIVFGSHTAVPVAELKHCIALALTYHLAKRRGKRT